MKVARTGAPLNAIGATVQQDRAQARLSVCDGLMGHGIGRRIHEAPEVPNTFERALSGSRSPRAW